MGYDREDLVSGRLRWTDLTPPEWLDRDAQQWLPEYKRTGILAPFEKEYFRKDGSRVPVLIGVASLEVIQEVLMLSQGEVRRNRVSVRTRFENDLPFVMGDKIQLQQVILNLVLNAIQAMSEVTEGPRELEVCSEKVSGWHGG